MRCSPRTIKLE
jgi:DNA replication protein DnaC